MSGKSVDLVARYYSSGLLHSGSFLLAMVM
jgi:hypothetical protein